MTFVNREYATFCKLLRESDILTSCVLAKFVDVARKRAFDMLGRAYKGSGLPLARLAKASAGAPPSAAGGAPVTPGATRELRLPTRRGIDAKAPETLRLNALKTAPNSVRCMHFQDPCDLAGSDAALPSPGTPSTPRTTARTSARPSGSRSRAAW